VAFLLFNPAVRSRCKRLGLERAVLALLLGVTVAHAQSSAAEIAGTWRAGATSIDVMVESWGGDCGPRPQSTKSNGGGLVTVEQREQALLLHGRDQDIRTDACWSRNPAMKRTIASHANGEWMTRCRTADNDPRAEQGTYTLKLSDDDTLIYTDISRYDWALNESKCVATFTTSQTLTRSGVKQGVARVGKNDKPDKSESVARTTSAPTRTETPDTPSAADNKSCTPGTPAKLTLRPRRAEIEVGQRVCLRARVADADDCSVPGAQVEWSLSHSKALRGSLNGGCFFAADTAAEAEGEFRISAKSDGLSAEGVVVVRHVDLSALIATRMEGTGLTDVDDQEPAENSPKAVARIATHTSAAESSPARRGLMIALGLCAMALTAAGFVISRRKAAAIGGDAEPSEPATDASEPDHDASDPDSDDAPASESPLAPWICPTCRVGYPAQQHTCPKDGTALIPYAEFTKRQKRDDIEHSKRCPTCGKTYPASASFCGDDGRSLVEK
jgi:hypothetical protein